MPEAPGPWEWGQHSAPPFASPLVHASKTDTQVKRCSVGLEG